MTVYYAGIGSRMAPPDVLQKMEEMAGMLARAGMVLRSGGARGADTAFERGARAAGGKMEIFRPEHCTEAALAASAPHHPAWDSCLPVVQRLHGRNAQIILGNSLDNPVLFVLCWTPCGKVVGGTGQAIRIAKAHNVDVINLGAYL